MFCCLRQQAGVPCRGLVNVHGFTADVDLMVVRYRTGVSVRAGAPGGDQVIAGTQMEVLYDPADPTDVRVAESFHAYRWNLVITLIGLVIAALGFVMVRASLQN